MASVPPGSTNPNCRSSCAYNCPCNRPAPNWTVSSCCEVASVTLSCWDMSTMTCPAHAAAVKPCAPERGLTLTP
eukprot:scaffold34631_cov251-Amphora_coffeaeformis.AAC.5